MTDILGQRAAGVLVPVRQVRDRARLDTLLGQDRAFSAYALSHLEPGPFERTEFWVAESPTGIGIVLTSDAIGATLITVGDATAVAAALSLHPGPRLAYLSTAAPHHLEAIARWHHVDDALTMRRMSVTRAAFAPVEGSRTHAEVRRLSGADASAANALYSLDDRSAQYSARQIEQAIYFGAFEGGRLVAIAGTHVVSPMMSVGVVGNVLTHPAFRGRGLATHVTSRVTSAILEAGCALAVLTADPLNTPAVRAYQRLGYQQGAEIVEARLRRRDQLGIGAWWRRHTADRSLGAEAVRMRITGVAPEKDRGSSR